MAAARLLLLHVLHLPDLLRFRLGELALGRRSGEPVDAAWVESFQDSDDSGADLGSDTRGGQGQS
ncbi:MAG: hypothetical protein WCI65_10300 [Synechococcaceae cyanobacterium ELA263]